MIKLPIILVDNGHGVETPGKRSPETDLYSPLYFREYLWTRHCASAVCDLLQASGFTSFLLVKGDKDVPLPTRCEWAKAYCRGYGDKNVILVSIHNNAAGSDSKWHDARGWSAYTTPGVTESDKIAAAMYDVAEREFKKQGKSVRRFSKDLDFGRDFESNLYILKNVPCPAVLVENFFQDNKDDVKYLNSDIGLATCAQVISDGIEEYINSIE